MAGAEGWDWLAGKFDLEQVLSALGRAMHRRWASWIDGCDANRQAALVQLVLHVMRQEPVARACTVPHTTLQWEDLEEAGMAHLSNRESHLHRLPCTPNSPLTPSELNSVSSDVCTSRCVAVLQCAWWCAVQP